MRVQEDSELLPMPSAVKSTYRLAGERARALYPGPVGELIAREMLAWTEFGWMLGADSLATRVRDHVLSNSRPA